MDCQQVGKGLEDYKGTKDLNFAQFEDYLQNEVFSSLSDSASRKILSPLECRIDEACWIITKSKLMQISLKEPTSFDADTGIKLFRIFCLLADLVRDEEGNAQVCKY